MNSKKRERSRDHEYKLLSSHSPKKTNKNLFPNLLNSSTSKDNKSSGSNSFGFQKSNAQENITIDYSKVKNFKEFKLKLDEIESPCFLDSIDFLELNDKLVENEDKSFEISKDKFKNISLKNIIPLNSLEIKQRFFNKKRKEKKIVFSSSLFQQNNKPDEKLFNRIHNYMSNFSEESNITDFCFNKELLFGNSFNNKYYDINRDYTKCFRAHHYYEDYGKIISHFGPKGCGKSLSSRAIIHNYMHLNLVDGYDVFIPTLFFDLKILAQLCGKKEKFFEVIKYEAMGIFRNYKDWENFVSFFEDKIKCDSVFDCLNQMIEIFYSKNPVNSKLLIVIDHYSEFYDISNNEINKLKNKCLLNKNFCLYIIYDIKNKNDQQIFLDYFKKNIFLAYLPKEKVSLDLDSNDIACYHKYELKNFFNMKHHFIHENYFNNYQKYFSKNVSYYFKYNSTTNLDFEEFVKIEKEEIKSFFRNYYNSDNQDLLYALLKMKEYLNRDIKKQEIIFENNYFLNFPATYFLFTKIEESNKFTIKPSFPLVSICINELLDDFDKDFFIDLKNKQFMELDGATMGNIFDRFMNKWFAKKANTKLFQYSKNEIEIIHLKYTIKKNYKDITIKDMIYKEVIINEIKSDNELLLLKDYYLNNKIENKKCIIIFQTTSGKSLDILLIVKRDGSEYFSINCFQMKCSNDFKINDKLYQENQYELTYLKNKFELILNIEIDTAYFTYISIKEIPKLCAMKNKLKFFYYSIQEEKLIDNNNQEIIEVPFYDDCKIDLINEDIILRYIQITLEYYFFNKKFKFQKIKNHEQIQKQKNLIIIKVTKEKICFKYNVLGREETSEKINDIKIEPLESYYRIEII